MENQNARHYAAHFLFVMDHEEGVSVSVGSGVGVSVSVGVGVGESVTVGVGVLVGVREGVKVGVMVGVFVNVTGGRLMEPVNPSGINRSRRIHPPSYCCMAGSL